MLDYLFARFFESANSNYVCWEFISLFNDVWSAEQRPFVSLFFNLKIKIASMNRLL